MKAESRVPATPPLKPSPRLDRQPNPDRELRPGETKLDQVFAALVCGLTAAFVAFIFGLVTEYIHHPLYNLSLSLFVGLCIGIIAYVLMASDEKI
ncbi:MAG TPA: hypothetical protein VJ302_25585 [Blastocatellia bacterium]|nr:hypothetical protein [Blastocatellia bacterium]